MGTQRIDQLIISLASAQHGAIAAFQVLRKGGTYDHIRRRVRNGMLARAGSGLYTLVGFGPSWEQDLWLAHLDLGPGSAVNGRSAARLHGFRRFDDDTVEVLSTASRHQAPVRGRAHETFWLPPEHVVTVRGLPVTSIARTVFDLAGLPRHPLAFRHEPLRENHIAWVTWLVNAAIRDHGLRMAELHSVLSAIGRRGKPGTAIIRTVVDDLGQDYEPTDSELEDVFLALVRSAGLPEPDPQVDLGTVHEWVGRVDFFYRRFGFVVECDGRTHRAPLERRSDRRRDAMLAGEHLQVIRFTWWQLVHEPEACLARLRQAITAAA